MKIKIEEFSVRFINNYQWYLPSNITGVIFEKCRKAVKEGNYNIKSKSSDKLYVTTVSAKKQAVIGEYKVEIIRTSVKRKTERKFEIFDKTVPKNVSEKMQKALKMMIQKDLSEYSLSTKNNLYMYKRTIILKNQKKDGNYMVIVSKETSFLETDPN